MLAPVFGIGTATGGTQTVFQQLNPGRIIAVIAVDIVNKMAFFQIRIQAHETSVFINPLAALKDDVRIGNLPRNILFG